MGRSTKRTTETIDKKMDFSDNSAFSLDRLFSMHITSHSRHFHDPALSLLVHIRILMNSTCFSSCRISYDPSTSTRFPISLLHRRLHCPATHFLRLHPSASCPRLFPTSHLSIVDGLKKWRVVSERSERWHRIVGESMGHNYKHPFSSLLISFLSSQRLPHINKATDAQTKESHSKNDDQAQVPVIIGHIPIINQEPS
jgi:hypothetical protein